ncbi:hypothetical protein [Ideonella sp. YS5]|uniref:hypothetical protein n=1 Tax=Ideonella sp. YS5 TaxID=3453714 RepID=UPI003EEF7DA4
MGAIKNAFKSIAKGIEKAVHGAAQFAKGMATLNLKAAAQGLKEIAHAGTDIARGVINLTPAALAANTLLDGALDKVLKKASSVVDKVADTMVDNVEGGLSNIKNGLENTVKGLATGDFSKVASGLKDLALGAVETASNFGPGGIAKNVARMAVDAAIDVASQQAMNAAAKVLDPNGTSKLGGMAVDLIGAGIAGGAGASRAGKFANGEVDTLRKRPGMDDGLDACGPNGFKAGARDAVEHAALDMAETMIHQAVGELMTKLQSTLDPNGNSSAVDHGVNSLSNLLDTAASDAIDRRRQRVNDRSQAPQGPGPANQPQGPNGVDQTHASHQSLRADVRDAVEMAVMQAVEAAIQTAVMAAIDKAMQSLPNDQKGAFAALALMATEDALLNATNRATTGRVENRMDSRGMGGAGGAHGANGAGGAGGPNGANGSGGTMRDIAQGLKQDMRNAIESAVQMAVELAVQAVMQEVTEQVMKQIGQPGSQQCIGQQGNPLHDGLRGALEKTIESAAKQAIGATVQAVADTAGRALAAGLEQELGKLLHAGGGVQGHLGQGGGNDVNLHIHIRA